MYQREFDQQLRESFPKAVLLYGDNDYLIEHYISLYKEKLDAKEGALVLYFDEWNFEQAKSYLSQTSLFGGTNLLIVKYDKKIPKKELDQLIELTNKNTDNYFLFIYNGEQKNAKSITTAFTPKKAAAWVRFFEPNIREGTTLLQQKAQKIPLYFESNCS